MREGGRDRRGRGRRGEEGGGGGGEGRGEGEGRGGGDGSDVMKWQAGTEDGPSATQYLHQPNFSGETGPRDRLFDHYPHPRGCCCRLSQSQAVFQQQKKKGGRGLICAFGERERERGRGRGRERTGVCVCVWKGTVLYPGILLSVEELTIRFGGNKRI
jgi:hypothetical protein